MARLGVTQWSRGGHGLANVFEAARLGRTATPPKRNSPCRPRLQTGGRLSPTLT